MFRNISIGSGFGITHFQGDISRRCNFQPAFVINLDKKIDNRSNFQLEFMIGRLSGRQYFAQFVITQIIFLMEVSIRTPKGREKFRARVYRV